MVWRCVACLLVVVLLGSQFASGVSAQQERPLAPGVLTVIPPDIQPEETLSGPMELVEIVKGMPELDWQPNYEAKSRTAFERRELVVLRRQVYCLEFAFKPLRTIEVDVPQSSGKMQKKARLVHGLPRAVSGRRSGARPESRCLWPHDVRSEAGRARGPILLPAVPAGEPRSDQDLSGPDHSGRLPGDRRARRSRGEPLLNSVDMAVRPIPLSTADNPQDVWGVATWEDIDPAHGLLHRLCPRADQRLQTGRSAGRLSARATHPARVATSWPKPCGSTSGDPATRSTSRRMPSTSGCPMRPSRSDKNRFSAPMA